MPYVVGGVALAAIVAIVLTMTTGLAERLLPMEDKYLAVLVPRAADGSEGLSLQTLNQTSDNKTTLSVEGSVLNRTESTIAGLVAAVEVNDRFGLHAQTVNIPVEPAELASKAVGTFKTTVMLGENGLGGYTLQFRLGDDGPFVPHKDEHPSEPILIGKPAQ